MSEHEFPEHDAQLSALYRRTMGDTPTPRLDAQVISLARRHAAGDRKLRQRRWLPLASAAVVVLALGLVLHLQQSPEGFAPQPIVATPQPSAAAPAPAPMAELAQKEEGKASRTEQQLQRDEASARSVVQSEELRAKAKPAAPAVPGEAEQAGIVARKPQPQTSTSDVAAMPARPVAPPPAAGVAASEPNAAALSDQATEAKQAENAPRTAAVPMKKSLELEPPQAWLQRIEALRAKGELEAAKRELTAFRKAYPAWTLPKELQQLLPPALPEEGK